MYLVHYAYVDYSGKSCIGVVETDDTDPMGDIERQLPFRAKLMRVYRPVDQIRHAGIDNEIAAINQRVAVRDKDKIDEKAVNALIAKINANPQ